MNKYELNKQEKLEIEIYKNQLDIEGEGLLDFINMSNKEKLIVKQYNLEKTLKSYKRLIIGFNIIFIPIFIFGGFQISYNIGELIFIFIFSTFCLNIILFINKYLTIGKLRKIDKRLLSIILNERKINKLENKLINYS